MGILCGVDIVEIDRIKKSIETTGDAFRRRIFTMKEIEYCEARNIGRYKSYAARFAAKEAVSKAFGTGISSGMGWTNIEILNDERGKPFVSLSGRALELFNEINGVEISLSLSHSENYAVAYAVLVTEKS